jgi:hypothetical protein
MRDPNRWWRVGTAVAVAEMVIAAVFMPAGGSSSPTIQGAAHVHAGGALHQHPAPIGGPHQGDRL